MTNQDEELICSACGFPKAMKRNPVFIKDDIFSLIKFKENVCEECGHQKDGTSIPVVQEAIRKIMKLVRSKALDEMQHRYEVNRDAAKEAEREITLEEVSLVKIKMRNSTLEILKCAVNLSGEHNKDFTEVDLASASALQIKNVLEIIQSDELKPFLHLTRKSKIDCPKCGSKIEADNGLEYCFCSECSEEINLNNCPFYTIGINQERVQEYLVDFLLNEFEKSGWKNRDSDENFFVIKKAEKSIALSLCTSGNGLKDYFALRGWAIDYDPQSYVIISQNFDKFISSYSDKDLKCVLMPLTEIFKDNFISGMLEEISKRVDVYQKDY